MFNNIVMIVFFLFINLLNSQAQVYQWAKYINSEGFDQAYDIVSDPQGFVYVAGQIEFVADFGGGVLIEAAGVHDIFIAKYTPAGRLVWAKGAGGKGGDKAHSIALDGLGNLFIGGEYEDTCYFDHIMKTTGVAEVNNMFVAKYDTSGNVQWVKNVSVDGPLQTRGYAVSCDLQGNVYACGGTKGDTYFENNFLFTTAGDYDATVFKFSDNGNLVWARRLGGVESDKAYGILNDNNGYIYVTGYFVGLAYFAPGVSLTGRGGTDAFLAKFDTAGTLQWVKQAGDAGFERGWDITQNINGDIVITGEFQGQSIFGSNIISSRGNNDMFLAAYNSNGTNLWALGAGGPEDDIGRGVTHDNSGNLFVIGDYGGSATFPPYSISGNGFSEVFLASYDDAGTVTRWVRSIGGYENDRGRGVAADNSGNVYICGEYVDSVKFDNITLHGNLLLDMFVSKVVTGNFCSTQLSVNGQVACHAACDGTVVATVTGLAPYTYSWSTSPVQTGQTATGLCAGSYTVLSTDAVGCTSTATITLNDPPATQLSATPTDASCFSVCDGSASASATGQGPFTYEWSTSPVQNGASANGLCAGTFTVTSTDNHGCTASKVVVINQPPQIQINTSKTDPDCFGSCNGTALANASGSGTVTYSWSTNPVQNGASAIALCDGVYTLTCTDANTCTGTSSVTIINPPQLQVSTLANDISCNGVCDGSALASANGNGPFTYSWSVNPPQTGTSIGSLCAGTYSVICTDVALCSMSSSVTIVEPLPLQISSTITNATCIACTDGSVDIQISGGTGTMQFAWSNGTSTEDLLNVGSGTYTLCVTDANSCTLCDTFLVLAPGTGVSIPDMTVDFSVYPNPFNLFISIRLQHASPELTSLSMYNAVGQVVYTNDFFGNEFRFSTEVLSSGVYFLQIKNPINRAGKIVPVLLEK